MLVVTETNAILKWTAQLLPESLNLVLNRRWREIGGGGVTWYVLRMLCSVLPSETAFLLRTRSIEQCEREHSRAECDYNPWTQQCCLVTQCVPYDTTQAKITSTEYRYQARWRGLQEQMWKLNLLYLFKTALILNEHYYPAIARKDTTVAIKIIMTYSTQTFA
jgi:hypothetical protein